MPNCPQPSWKSSRCSHLQRRGGVGGRKTKGRMPEWLSLKWALERTAVLLAKPFRAWKALGQLSCCTGTAKQQSHLPTWPFFSFLLFIFSFPLTQFFYFSLIFSPECLYSKALGLLKIIQALLFLFEICNLPRPQKDSHNHYRCPLWGNARNFYLQKAEALGKA